MVRRGREHHRPRQQRQRAAGNYRHPPRRQARQALAHVIGKQVAEQDCQHGNEYERGVHGTAEQIDARHVFERQGINGRVAAEHVEQRHHQHAGEEAPAVAHEAAAGNAEPQEQNGGAVPTNR